MTAETDLKKVFKGLQEKLGKAVSRREMEALGAVAVNLIVKRTRLGYGVKSALGSRFALSSIKWSDRYAKLRKTYPLDPTTRPKKSNLTLTGQMLRSVRVLTVTDGSVTLGPKGSRVDTDATNEQIAEYNAKRGRIFMNLSQAEYGQMVRYYRRRFTDLLKRLARIS
jgi:hypothetical protein